MNLTFRVDGKLVPCVGRKVSLRLGNQTINPEPTLNGFVVPRIFAQAYASEKTRAENNVEVSITCGDDHLSFSGLYPVWVSAGDWEVGISHPPYWFELFSRSPAIEHGTWVSYLESECAGCDPGVITSVPHVETASVISEGLLHEQPMATGERARDIAYTLAVYGRERELNANYLANLLKSCLVKADSSEDAVCDSRLLAYLTNLYWRGSDGLLVPLMRAATSRKDVISDVGTFYSDLLDRRPDAALHALEAETADIRQAVCKLAQDDDLYLNAPKRDRVVVSLRRSGNRVATECLKEISPDVTR